MSAPDWLEARLRAYLARLGISGAQADTLAREALALGDPGAAFAHLRSALAQAAPDTGAAWVEARLAARYGIATDARRALMPQLAPLARRSMAAQPFGRPTLRRVLAATVYRPLGALLRRLQVLSGQEAS